VGVDGARLPLAPDLVYAADWRGWVDFLASDGTSF